MRIIAKGTGSNVSEYSKSVSGTTDFVISQNDFAAIKNQYPDLKLGNYAEYNFIEIAASELSAVSLRAAITAAGSEYNDIIVCRTTTTQNTITLSSEFAINLNAKNCGSVTIVSLGSVPLTIDADGKSRVLNISSGSEVALAGLTITKGAASSGTGIRNDGTLTVAGCTISNNTGDGISNTGTEAFAT